VSARAMITPDRLAVFSHLMREKLDTGDTPARKAYLRSIISQIEVDDDKIRIVGDKATLAAVIAGGQTGETRVRGFVRKWRTRRDSNSRPLIANPADRLGNVVGGTAYPAALFGAGTFQRSCRSAAVALGRAFLSWFRVSPC